jgi:hypothetical protein
VWRGGPARPDRLAGRAGDRLLSEDGGAPRSASGSPVWRRPSAWQRWRLGAGRLREAQLIAVQSAADAASRAILHPLPPVVAGVPVAATYVSASEAARIGGDLYDAVATEHGLRMVIGDVRGKGLEAGPAGGDGPGCLPRGAHREADLQRVAAAMHDAVRRDAGPEDFITAVLVEVRDEAVQMLGCGHPHPLRLRAGLGLGAPAAGGPAARARPSGPPVLVDVRPGDRVLLFTDGAVEARRAGRFFPLQDAVRDTLAAGSLDAAVEALSRQVQEYTERGAEDDVALLASSCRLCRRRPSSRAEASSKRRVVGGPGRRPDGRRDGEVLEDAAGFPSRWRRVRSTCRSLGARSGGATRGAARAGR